MFGQQKTDVDKKISSLSDEIFDLKNQRKLAELDFEKRVLLLEDAVSTINKTVGSAKNLKEMKENLAHIIDVQGKLREIEDRQLIDRLESMQSADTLGALEGSVGTISKKLDLISDAVKILGGKTKEGHAAIAREKIDAGQKDAEAIRAELAALRAEKADRGAIQAIEVKCSSLESAMKEIDRNFADLASSARDTLKKRDNDLAVVQKRISELESLPIKTDKLASCVDSLATVDKKIEAAISSLRSQIAVIETRVAPIDSLQKAGKQIFSDLKQVKSDFESAKKILDETLSRNSEEYSERLESDKAFLLGEIKKVQNSYAGIKKLDNDLAITRKKISELESLSVKTEVFVSGVDALIDANKKTGENVSSLRKQVSLIEEKTRLMERPEFTQLKKDIEHMVCQKSTESEKKILDETLKRTLADQAKAAEADKASAKGELRKIQDAYFAVERDYGVMKGALDELSKTLEKRVEMSAEDVLKREMRLHEESLATLRSSNKKMVSLEAALEETVDGLNAKYERVCSILGEKNVSDFIKRVEEIKKIEAGIRRDLYAEITAKTEKLLEGERGQVAALAKNYESLERALPGKVKDIVEEEMRDVTANLKKITDIAQKKEIKPEDIEHIVESKLATVAADYNKLGKALGTIQRVVKEEHVIISKSMHDKIDSDMKPVLDEIRDLREDIEQVKNLRSDLVDDVNRIIAGYEDKNKIREIKKLENAEDYEASRMDSLEGSFNKKLVELMHRMEDEFKKSVEEKSFSDAGMEDKFSMLERENQALRADLEELKRAYFQIMKLQQSAPIIIE